LHGLPRAAWAAGTAFSLLLLAAGLIQLHRIGRRATVVRGGMWAATSDALTRTYGIARPVMLLQADHPSRLVTWGSWRACIMLPASASAWIEERARWPHDAGRADHVDERCDGGVGRCAD
jgi:hypothetical protein